MPVVSTSSAMASTWASVANWASSTIRCRGATPPTGRTASLMSSQGPISIASAEIPSREVMSPPPERSPKVTSGTVWPHERSWWASWSTSADLPAAMVP